MADQSLTQPIIKLLSDKNYNKRKEGAQEVEKLIGTKLQVKDTAGIEHIIMNLGQNFANSNLPQLRNGGLIGLAACAIALGKEVTFSAKESVNYVELLVQPPLLCFGDPDSKIRYYACESLFNISKIARASTLPFFNDVFDGLSKLTADENAEVRSGADILNRLLKDIVSGNRGNFDVPAFIPLLRERIYTKKPHARKFIVEWVRLLNNLPDLNILVYLPEIIDGLFLILGENGQEIRNLCQEVLEEFLQEIKKSTENHAQGVSDDDFQVDFQAMTNILILHSQSPDSTMIQYRALIWLEQFIKLAGRKLVPFCPGIVESILPTLAYVQENKKQCKDCAIRVNTRLTQLVINEDDQPESKLLDSSKLVVVLGLSLQTSEMLTKIACLKWFLHLFNTIPNKIFQHVEEIFPLLFVTLSDVSDEVVIDDLNILASIANSHTPTGRDLIGSSLPPEVKETLLQRVSQYFIYCIQNLLKTFSSDKTLLDEKGQFIIRHLCLLLDAENVFITMSELLQISDNLNFCSIMIRHLNTILLTASELFQLRNTLKQKSQQEGSNLFNCLYYSWCHNPVAAVALSLLNREYRLACDLLQKFGSIDITVDLLTEIDKLVQLLESPIFIYLRLQLLEQEYYLIKSLYSLLMLLPQSEAFKTLQGRMHCVTQLHSQDLAKRPESSAPPDHVKLLEHFTSIQQKHLKKKRENHMKKTHHH